MITAVLQRSTRDRTPLREAWLLAPLRPRKLVAIDVNHLDHMRECRLDRLVTPLVFTKFTMRVVGTWTTSTSTGG